MPKRDHSAMERDLRAARRAVLRLEAILSADDWRKTDDRRRSNGWIAIKRETAAAADGAADGAPVPSASAAADRRIQRRDVRIGRSEAIERENARLRDDNRQLTRMNKKLESENSRERWNLLQSERRERAIKAAVLKRFHLITNVYPDIRRVTFSSRPERKRRIVDVVAYARQE